MRTLIPVKKVQGVVALDLREFIDCAIKNGSSRKPHNISIVNGRTIRAKYFLTMPINLVCGRDEKNVFFKFRIDCILKIEPLN